MKERMGFVSNSSSSSFVLRGIEVKTSALEKMFKDRISPEPDDPEKYDEKSCYSVEDVIDSLGLTTLGESEYDENDYTYIGTNLRTVDNGETIELKEPSEEGDAKLKAALEKAGFDDPKIRTFIRGTSQG